MANDGFNLFVSIFVNFSINGLNENAENLNYYPILRRKVELYLFMSTHHEWESFFCRFFQCCQQWLQSRWVLYICSVLCLVNLLARTVFENICLPFFSINQLLFIGKIGLGRKSWNHKTVQSGLVSLCSGEHSFEHTKRQQQ